MSNYDIVVIGAGTAGESVIWSMQAAGQKIAVVEHELIGGLCAYWGCIPSKTLLRPGSVRWEAEHGFGVSLPSLTWPDIARQRDRMVNNWNDHRQVEEYRNIGIDFFRGTAMIMGPGKVQVNGKTLETKRIAIASGSVSSIPPIEGLQDTGYWTNREATAMQDVPGSILVLGGGAVGSELAQVFHSLGTEVTIVEEADQLLGHENPEAAQYVQSAFQQRGITVHLSRKAVKFERHDGRRTATLDNGQRVTADEVLVATGRRPRIDGLGLEHVGIEPTKQGVPINEQCRAADGVWAVGDVTGIAGFTHVADYQGAIAVADMLGNPRQANYSAIPRVTYTDPEVAAVGQTDPNRMPPSIDLITGHVDLNEISRTGTYGQNLEGALCLYADRNDRVLIGAWAAGPLAGEWVQFATLAIRARVPIATLDDTILAFPTFTRGYLEPIKKLQEQLK